MESLITIFREVEDPRDINARHDLGSMLFVSLVSTLCGAKSCVDIADFAETHVDTLSGIVDLRHGAPSHDCFSRLFRLLDPTELNQALMRFTAALRRGLGLGPARGRWRCGMARRLTSASSPAPRVGVTGSSPQPAAVPPTPGL